MSEEEQLRNGLEEVHVPPSRVEVDGLVRDGRLMAVRRRSVQVAGGTALAVALLAVPVTLTGMRAHPTVRSGTGAAASPSPSQLSPIVAPVMPVPGSCHGVTLPIPDNVSMALVTAADPTGTVIFGRSYPKGADHHPILLWENGKTTKIDIPGTDQNITAVNTAGNGGVVAVASSVVIGSGLAEDEADVPRAYLYRDGKVTLLPGGKGAQAYGINASNAIVGKRYERPVIWPSPTSNPVELTLPSGYDSGSAIAIDDDGTVVGTIYATESRMTVGFVWAPDGTGRVLPLPAGSHALQPDGTLIQSYGAGAVRNGWVTGGIIENNTGPEQGLRWNLRSGAVEAMSDFFPDTTNASGWMVGNDRQGRAVLRADDRNVILPDVFQHASGGDSKLPGTISDDGRTIAGQANDAQGTIHAVVWHCR